MTRWTGLFLHRDLLIRTIIYELPHDRDFNPTVLGTADIRIVRSNWAVFALPNNTEQFRV
jgi:hypothetical protein